MLVQSVLKKLIRKGNLTLTDWKGRMSRYGDGTGTPVHVQIMSASAARKIAIDPDFYLGEMFMSGDFKMLRGRIYDFLELAVSNMNIGTSGTNKGNFVHNLLYKGRIAMRRLDQANSLKRSRSNVHSHYDLSGALYDLFLDSDRQYSCAYYENDGQTLEEAQLAKKRHIAAKMNIKPGMKILDIGCGWGGMGLYLAEMYGADVTGVTLSDEQLAVANARAAERGISNRVRFLLQDYRTLTQKFDRIVSVGMFEHVGVGHFGEFFKKVSELLAPDGTVLLHSINRSDGPGATSAWVKKYIFPGGYIPSLSEVMPHLERHALYVTDVEILRLHYAKTLRAWLDRFLANRDKAAKLYDERFCRMWEFYLAASETSFRYWGMNNFQIQFGHDQHYLPFTRDYIMAEEARLRTIEAKSPYYKAAALKPPAAQAVMAPPAPARKPVKAARRLEPAE